MSATPRTDAECYWHTSEDGWHLLEKTTPDKGNWVPSKFARQLEQELTAALERAANLEKALAAKDSEITQLRAEIKVLELDVADLETDNNELRNQI